MFERADRIGGLLRYGIPEFKMEKRVLDRRLALMEEEGVVFRTSANVGVDVPVDELQREFDAIVLAGGADAPRDLPVPGRELERHPLRDGVPDAAEPALRGRSRSPTSASSPPRASTWSSSAAATPAPTASAPRTARARASVHQLELLPRPPDTRAADNPWPHWPNIFRVSGAHEEGGERVYAVSTQRFTGDAAAACRRCTAVNVEMVARGRPPRLQADRRQRVQARRADLVLLAMGFLGPERTGPIEELGVKLTERGNVGRDANWMTSVPGVFTAGDMQRGQSLIVWAIAEGRSCAAGVDRWLMGRTDLPSPL